MLATLITIIVAIVLIDLALAIVIGLFTLFIGD